MDPETGKESVSIFIHRNILITTTTMMMVTIMIIMVMKSYAVAHIPY